MLHGKLRFPCHRQGRPFESSLAPSSTSVRLLLFLLLHTCHLYLFIHHLSISMHVTCLCASLSISCRYGYVSLLQVLLLCCRFFVCLCCLPMDRAFKPVERAMCLYIPIVSSSHHGHNAEHDPFSRVLVVSFVTPSVSSCLRP
jgi:hypothetical protein